MNDDLLAAGETYARLLREQLYQMDYSVPGGLARGTAIMRLLAGIRATHQILEARVGPDDITARTNAITVPMAAEERKR